MNWFGEPWPRADWRAPICEDDAKRIPVPVGEACVLCEEPIEENDRGVTMGVVRLGDDGKPTGTVGYVHAECNLRSVTGNHLHITGQCRHVGDCNERSDLTYREEALEVWRLQVMDANA